jgi:DNA helicase-2/ATP-dependent DNA helicase PcrA
MAELQDIMNHIHEGHDFLLSGGAGSGKTYTLVEVITQIIRENPHSKIACVTYTNAAVMEIENRVNHRNLHVSTIHDFLWDCIGNFQKELQLAVINLINDGVITRGITDSLPLPLDYYSNRDKPATIQYQEHIQLSKGVISHDEVLVVAEYMFAHYKKLNDIIQRKYPFVLIDEYQDTNETVIKILLEHFKKSNTKSVVGFFGDSMQCIYDDGVGDIECYIHPNGDVYEVRKVQNRRNPQNVIDLANKIRTDGLIQQPSDDGRAPNMDQETGGVKAGTTRFIYTDKEDLKLDAVRDYLNKEEYWNLTPDGETKELNLTHNLISEKAGFGTLMEIHQSDKIIDYRDRVKKFVNENGVDTDGLTFGQVLEKLCQLYTDPKDVKKFTPTESMKPFIDAHPELMSLATTYDYNAFLKMYVDKDQLVDDKKQNEGEEAKKGSNRSGLIKYLYSIEESIASYEDNAFADFLRKTQIKISKLEDKRRLKAIITEISNSTDLSIGEVVELAQKYSLVGKDDVLEKYKMTNPYVFYRVSQVPYQEFRNLYQYLEGATPFSTQHKTKGAEFDNVFVILDNGNWRNYNFEKLFTSEDFNNSVVKRTRKLFYVCCTRAKNNLAVYYKCPSQQVLDKAVEWFGEGNIIKIG